MQVNSIISPIEPDENVTPTKKPNLTNSQRRRIYELLLEESRNGKLPRGLLKRIAERFGVHPLTITRIWRQGRQSVDGDATCADVSSRIAKKSGRKKLPIDFDLLEQIPPEKRTSIREMALHSNISMARLHRAMKGVFVKKGEVYQPVRRKKLSKESSN